MENAHEKLKCLDYELLFVRNLQQRPVSKHEFILAAKNTGLQFNHYIQLIRWLLSQIHNNLNNNNDDDDDNNNNNKQNNNIDTESSSSIELDAYDDPNVTAQKLMLSLRELGFEMDFPITKLKQPYGEVATSILNFLADKALDSKGFEFIMEPTYIAAESKKDLQNDTENEDDHSDQEEIIVTDEETFEDSNDSIDLCYEITNFDNNDRFDSQSSAVTHEMISSQIDPIEWKIELERVIPALEVQFDDSGTTLVDNKNNNNNWKTQVSNALIQNKNILLEVEKSNDAFDRLSKESKRSLEMIEIKEQIINEKFNQITNEYNSFSGKIIELEEKQKQSSLSLTEMNFEITSLSKKVTEIKAKVDEKGNMMTDTSPLIRIKTTLKEIKAEIRDYDLQIGILEHNLVQRRLAKANAKTHVI